MSERPSRSPLCGAQTPPEQKRPTLWCQREKGHEPPHHVYGGDGKPIREWTAESGPEVTP